LYDGPTVLFGPWVIGFLKSAELDTILKRFEWKNSSSGGAERCDKDLPESLGRGQEAPRVVHIDEGDIQGIEAGNCSKKRAGFKDGR
jgi:hypothetical protein